MPYRPLQELIYSLRRVVASAGSEAATDADLLARFVNQHDENAFELLVWRHSKSVLAECRRVLRNDSDAEDAFQATFLVFARKARSIHKGESLGGWLLKVAFHIALSSKKRADKRANYERSLANVARPGAGDRADCRMEQEELRSVIDAEVNRLPERYRLPIVLCYFRGKTNKEVARELDRPLGTVDNYLARGRERLRKQLERRGVMLSAGLFAAGMTPTAGTAAVAPELVLATVKAALASRAAWAGTLSAQVATLVKAGLSSLAVSQRNWAAAALVALAVGAGAGWAVLQAAGQQHPQAQPVVGGLQTTPGKEDAPVGQPPHAHALPLTREQANALVRELCKRILERDAEDDNAYVEEILKGERDPIEVAWMMAHSKEYETRFLQNCSHEEAIRTLYAKLFRREPTDKEVEENAAFYLVLGWRETVYKVLTEDKGKTYAGQIGRKIGWKPLGEVRQVLDVLTGRRWKSYAGQAYERLAGKKDSKSH
jgi:RNA polymerase sigma factor (sigma-70 family)